MTWWEGGEASERRGGEEGLDNEGEGPDNRGGGEGRLVMTRVKVGQLGLKRGWANVAGKTNQGEGGRGTWSDKEQQGGGKSPFLGYTLTL